MVVCPNCGTENSAGRKFCGGCAAPLARVCPACGAANEPGMRFCGECAQPLDGDADAPPATGASAPAAPPAAERRLVSVLFADLVGFTTLAEDRDAEEVRELLSRYFETARTVIERYGGTIEKFIGDAVMAVWGTPVATEDDAERAVRAALELSGAVTALGEELSAPDLRARAGVLTGEAAVTLQAEGEGMVAGDLVNTASRVQAAAPPGHVFVGETTRRATEETIVYESAGTHELKGKTGLVPLWRALRVVSGARGSLRSSGLEAPFVGRARELRLIKDLFHASAEEGKAHLFSVTGIAGIGKSRLAWEFYKYFDGLTQIVYWHRGRCLAYGEGVTYWALADMIRMRARIAEDDEPATALAKLRATLDEHILDAEDRRFVEPRLAHLLGLEEHEARDRQDLFAAWRLFFERLAETYPTVLAFEDMQWADSSLLDFVEYLLEWSRDHPVYVVTLARPELLEQRPTWGAGRRNFTSLYLEQLPPAAMHELLAGLVPGLPEELRQQILERAEGIPLYAVETVRMLLDRGLLMQEGSVYQPVGSIESLAVPETLHALIAARLDGLNDEERRILQDGAVLGKTFTRLALAGISGRSEEELEPLLASLARKEVLSVQADPRSPERGQYGFLQDLVKRVAYETLSKRDRRARHLSAAAYLTHAFAGEEDEVVEVIASHYLAAFEAAPDADDADEIRWQAQTMLARAGERAAALAASGEAQRYFEQAAELAAEPSEKAQLLDRAGTMASFTGDPDSARRLLEESIALFEGEGDSHAAARVSARLGQVDAFTGHRDEALARMERAFAVISTDEPNEDLAVLASRLAIGYWFGGDVERAAERAELALDLAESLAVPEALIRALQAKAGIAESRGHPEEAQALMKHGLELAVELELLDEAARLCFSLSDASFRRDRYADALGYLRQGLELSRRLGDRPGEWSGIAESSYALYMTGRWDEALATLEELTEERARSGGVFLSLLTSVLEIHLHRDELENARRVLSTFSHLEGSTDVQEQACYLAATAALRRAEGRVQEALEAGAATIEPARTLGAAHQAVEQGMVEAVEAALALGDSARARELLAFLEELPPGNRPPYLEAQAHRFRARLADDEDAAAAGFQAAAGFFRRLEIPFWLAVTLLEHGERLRGQGLTGEADPLLAEARETFEQLRAKRWLERPAVAHEHTEATAV